ncbi:MAG TPA: hypothetical protein VJ912_04210 [Candidatus Nanoarchaeia archaeon]|nr:hypothetical protein [Candidatus Nanoarchaeia archaeon]
MGNNPKIVSKNDWKAFIVLVILISSIIISEEHRWVVGIVLLLIGGYLGYSAIILLKKGEWDFFAPPLSVTSGKIKGKKVILFAIIQLLLTLILFFVGIMNLIIHFS